MKCSFTMIAALMLIASGDARGKTQDVVDVHDGDTITLAARWGITTGPVDYDLGAVSVRLLASKGGIDTPEIGPKARCAAEQAKAEQARAFTATMIHASGGKVRLARVTREKYGRLLADVQVKRANGKWASVGDALISAGLAVRYDGEGARMDWCAAQPVNLLDMVR